MSWQEFLPTPKFDDYKEFFKDFFTLERRDDGVLLAQAHTRGGSVQLSVQNHRALGQFLKTAGADPENEVLILTGTGPDWMMGSDPAGFEIEENDLEYWAYEYAYKDGRINASALVNDLEIPTIGLINGDGYHSEILLMCDLTLMAEDARIYDLHYGISSVPGDGIHSAFQELLGVKRAAYALLTGESIDARTALEYGMVNEASPGDQLIARAYTIADHIMQQPCTIRRADHADHPPALEEADHRRPGRRLRHPDVRAPGEGPGGAQRRAHFRNGQLRARGPEDPLRLSLPAHYRGHMRAGPLSETGQLTSVAASWIALFTSFGLTLSSLATCFSAFSAALSIACSSLLSPMIAGGNRMPMRGAYAEIGMTAGGGARPACSARSCPLFLRETAGERTYGNPDDMYVVRGGVEPPTFRFSGVADGQVRGVTAAWAAADVCLRSGLVAVVAVTVAVSSDRCSDGRPPQTVGREAGNRKRGRTAHYESNEDRPRPSRSTERLSYRFVRPPWHPTVIQARPDPSLASASAWSAASLPRPSSRFRLPRSRFVEILVRRL